MNSQNVKKVRELANLIAAGIPPAHALNISGLQIDDSQTLGLHWNLARDLGAPIAASLENLAANLESNQEARRKVQLAFSTPRLTAKLIAWLPVAGLAMAQLLGLNPLGAIFSNFLALIAVLLGAALLFSGNYWSKRLLVAAEPNSADPGLFVDCIAIALEAGLPPNSARNEVLFRFAKHMGFEPSEAHITQTNQLLALATQTGAGAVSLLRASAVQWRREQEFAQLDQISKLNIKLLLPIGVTILPAFGLLTIVPVAFGFLANNK